MQVSYPQKFKKAKKLPNQNIITILNNDWALNDNYESRRSQTSKSDNFLIKRIKMPFLPLNLVQPSSAPSLIKVIPSTSQVKVLNPHTSRVILKSPQSNGKFVKIVPMMTPKFIKVANQMKIEHENPYNNRIQPLNFEPKIRKPSPKLMMINRENPMTETKTDKKLADKEATDSDNESKIESKVDLSTKVEELKEIVPKIQKVKAYKEQNKSLDLIQKTLPSRDDFQPVDYSKKLWYTKTQLDFKKESSDLYDSEKKSFIKNQNENVRIILI
jgi:hypothetical protein